MNMFWFPPRGTGNLPEKSCCPAPTKRKKDKQNRETLCKMRGGKTQGNSETPNEPLKRKNNVKKKS